MTDPMAARDRIQCAIDHLRSLHDGDLGVFEATACGEAAIPALRTLLFECDPSGLFQSRCRAVAALAALGATNVLTEFLRSSHQLADPVQQLGEDAVVNAAALAVAEVHNDFIFELLMSLANNRCLPGVIGALAASGRVDAVPILVEALAEDGCRITAEAALRKLGPVARPALLQTAVLCLPSEQDESDSSLRRRRSALALLAEMGVRQEDWPILRHLIQDTDPRIAARVCKICLACGSMPERREAIRRLRDLLARADVVLADEIEKALVWQGR